eukprot:2303082-Rhodomonas_salina.6
MRCTSEEATMQVVHLTSPLQPVSLPDSNSTPFTRTLVKDVCSRLKKGYKDVVAAAVEQA